SRTGVFWRTVSRTTVQLEDQEDWLGKRAAVDAATQKAAADLDAAQTLDSTRLVEAMKRLAADAGIPYRGEPGLARSANDKFSFNTLTVNSSLNDPNAQKNWDAVLKFYTSLEKKSPYIVMDQFVVQATQRNPAQLTLIVKVSALQIQ
ncbi:MAG: hypothetical protein ABIZ49_00985, partial [Opitutaceae bacterium]